MINQVVLHGNLTRDPELRYTQSGKAVCDFGLAVNESSERVHFFDVTVWDRCAETTEKYCSKGDPVVLAGKLTQDRWEDKEGQKRSKVKVVAYTVQFLRSKPREGSDEPPPPGGHYHPREPKQPKSFVPEDDIPF